MQKNILIDLISGFSRKEMTRFKEFSLSPYFCKHKEVRLLVTKLAQIYPDFSEKKCARQRLWKALFPKKKHDQAQLALLFTYTLRLLEEFMRMEQYRAQNNLSNQLLLKDLRQRRANKSYEKQLNRAQKELKQSNYQAGKYLENQYRLAAEADAWYTLQARHEKNDSLQQKQNFLDHWYIAEKLKDACEMRLRAKILKVEYQAGLLPKILVHINEHAPNYEHVPPIIIYRKIYQMIESGTVDDFFELKEQLITQEKYFPKAELQNIYNYLQNFCIEQINRGNGAFLTELFRIYQSQLAKELIFDHDNFLLEWHYKNIATVGIRLQEYDWTKAFIEQYRKRLKPDVVDNAYRYNLAAWYYATQQYQAVLPLLLQVEFTDIRYNLDAKSLLLRTYFDLEEYEAFLALCKSFRQFLKRNKLLSDFQRKGYENLIKLSRKAFQLRERKPFTKAEKWNQEKDKLRILIEKTEGVFNKGWLLLRVEN